MDRRVEVMAPAGNFECLMAAIQGGADSVYFGVGNLNMRSHSANNFKPEDIGKIVAICKEHNVRSYLTLNIVIYNEDINPMKHTLECAKEAGVTAVIASDMAVITYAREIGVEVHISTQLNVSNYSAVKFYSQFADVVVLSRELNLTQIKEISDYIKEEDLRGPSGNLIEIELFCHGALCMAVSGKCYLSLHNYNASANRGSCYQLCRRGYKVTDLETGDSLEIDNKYIMSPKDLCTIEFIDKILNAGVTVLKIEGRARSAEYVKKVVHAYKSAANSVLSNEFNSTVSSALKAEVSEVFNRGFWDGYYQGAKLGEWSEVYGNKATKKKIYVGKVTNYFSNIGVAEILVETGKISVGDNILIVGPSTGVAELKVEEIRVDLKPVESAIKGEYCSIAINDKLRRSDKVYLYQ